MNLTNLNTKLGALQEHVAAAGDLFGAHPTVPFLGNYTQQELLDWLQARIDLLSSAKINNYTDAQIATAIQNNYNALNAADQALADAIRAHQTVDLGLASNKLAYERLCAILLYTFLTEPA